MAKGVSVKSLLSKVYKTFKFTGVWLLVLGELERSGIWVIFGNEKNGKTQLALQLADYLSRFEKVMYISAEEGVGFSFQQNLKRANIDAKTSKIMFYEYLDYEEIEKILSRREPPRIVFFDNATVYVDDIKTAQLRRLRKNHPNTLFIIMAHEDKKEPVTAMAKLAKKLCTIFIRVEGLTAFVGGRCPGGIINIDLQKAMLYHGSSIIQENGNKK